MLTDFNGDGAKKIQNGQLKKTEFFNFTTTQYFFGIVSGMDP